MPDIAKINVVIGADVQPLVTGLQDVKNEIGGLGGTFDGLKTKVGGLGPQLEGVKTKFGGLASKTNEANLAMINLSRVAQDAPYGFIGIANNLNPLLESFQRLKATAGSNVGALKALGASLTGAGGIGLALGVVSSLAVVFSQHMNSATKSVDEAKASADDFKNAVKGIGEESAKELAKVRQLVSGFDDENTSRRQKISIINELKKINPTYFGQLDTEHTTINALKTAYDNYNGSIQNTIKSKIYGKQLEDLINKELQLGQVIEDNNKFLTFRKNLNKTDQVDPATFALAGKIKSQQIDINRNLEQQAKILEKINSLGGVLPKPSADSDSADTKVKTLTKDVNTLNESVVRLRDNLKFPSGQIAFDIPDLPAIVQSAMDKGPGITIKINKEQSEKDFQNAFVLQRDYSRQDAALSRQNKRLEQQQQLAGSIKDTFSNMFREIQTSGKNAFQILGEAVQRLVVQLVSAVAQTLILKIIMSAITGGAGAAVGLPHSLIQAGGVPIPHADGGIFTGPTQIGNHLFGEAGPEALIPLSRMNEMSSGMGSNMSVNGMFRISGNDLVLALNRGNVKIGRNYGTNFN